MGTNAARHAFLVIGVGGDHEDRRRAAQLLPERAEEGPSILPWHRDVQKDQVRHGARNRFPRSGGAGGEAHLEAKRTEEIADKRAMFGVVVDDEDRLARPAISRDARRRRAGADPPARKVQFHAKDAAFARRALHRQLAPEHLDQELGDGQAEARTVDRALRVFDPLE
ncbi:MAG: hypothetical protein AAFU55_14945, partial [Pseudomonadota bacterium]